jgi:hypothetical protein
MAHYVTERVRGVCTFDEAYFPTYEYNCMNGNRHIFGLCPLRARVVVARQPETGNDPVDRRKFKNLRIIDKN